MWIRSTRRQGGVTLIELIIAMVIVAAAVGGLIAARSTVLSSADPIVAKQMAAVAEGIMEEIVLKPYASAANAPAVANGRDTFNDVRDFAGYHTDGVYDINGMPVASLGALTVDIAVTPVALTDIPATGALQIIVKVSNGTESNTLTGWRSCYAGPPCT